MFLNQKFGLFKNRSLFLKGQFKKNIYKAIIQIICANRRINFFTSKIKIKINFSKKLINFSNWRLMFFSLYYMFFLYFYVFFYLTHSSMHHSEYFLFNYEIFIFNEIIGHSLIMMLVIDCLVNQYLTYILYSFFLASTK
ncbi:hypothetical protein BpHYR1_016592 [Brachionus plicatilis]|uniref:Uncharacterized protein n=1 Tax=Brachionus plicatilis TaxID=10195 RepID=A0A3M7SKR6_BRAPC|nr:hypothetical protein BpHYR1_016592 [Brachionus plicatilis]